MSNERGKGGIDILFTYLYFDCPTDDKEDKQDIRVLNELENIDDELEKEGIVIVRIDNKEEAKEYGLDHLPALVYFENKVCVDLSFCFCGSFK